MRAAARPAGTVAAVDAEHVAHALVRVVGVVAESDRLARVELAGDPERLEVGDRAAAGQVAEVLGEAEHRGQIAPTTSFSMPAVAGPPSRAWLLGLISMALA